MVQPVEVVSVCGRDLQFKQAEAINQRRSVNTFYAPFCDTKSICVFPVLLLKYKNQILHLIFRDCSNSYPYGLKIELFQYVW